MRIERDGFYDVGPALLFDPTVLAASARTVDDWIGGCEWSANATACRRTELIIEGQRVRL